MTIMLKKNIVKLFVPLFLFFLAQGSALAVIRTVEGTVVKVADGDTVTVETDNGTKLRCRLAYIDAPEIQHGKKPGQPYGNEAKAALAAAVQGKRVTVEIKDIDRYRRMVAAIWLGRDNVNLFMIRHGYAEAYVEYMRDPVDRSQYLRAQSEAKAEKRGIWSLPQYERPSDFRKRVRLRS